MLVRLPQTLYVTEHFQLGRFGQVVLSAPAAGSSSRPTSWSPGAPALALQAANDLNRIILDDASQAQNPDPILFGRGGQPLSASNTLRGGDTATGIVGVLNYTWAGNAASGNAYRVRPVNALGGSVNFVAANAAPDDRARRGRRRPGRRHEPAQLLQHLRRPPGQRRQLHPGVGGAPTDCRGADTPGRVRPPVAQDRGGDPRRSTRTSSASTRSRTTATAPTAPSQTWSTGSTPPRRRAPTRSSTSTPAPARSTRWAPTRSRSG